MNEFEKSLANMIGKKNLEKIQSQKIGIAGAGGLGSNCAMNLIRSGFKSLVIADFDELEYSNLNRQFYYYNQVGTVKVKELENNLLQINPDADLEVISEKITSDNVQGFFRDCDIIIEAFDKVSAKKIIVESYMNSDKFLVSASGLAGWGNSDQIKTKKVNESFFMVGDFETGVNEEHPPLSPRVNIAAGKQVDIILSHVLDN